MIKGKSFSGSLDDTLIGYAGSDTYDPGAGTDTIVINDASYNWQLNESNEVEDIIIYKLGYEQVTVSGVQMQGSLTSNDIVIFGSGITIDNIQFERYRYVLKIHISDGGLLIFKNWYNTNPAYVYKVKEFRFYDGQSISYDNSLFPK